MLHLVRIDHDRNMRRFYRLDMQPTLFGEYAVVKEWGRIGAAGRVTSTPYPTPEAAVAALAKHCAVKERRGYQPQGKPAMHGSRH